MNHTMTTSHSRVKKLGTLDEYRAFLHSFNWFHDREKDFSVWATAKNEMMYLERMAGLSSDLFKHEFNLHYCAFYGVSPTNAPFSVTKNNSQVAAVTLREIERLQEELGIPKLEKTRQEPWK